MYCPYCEKNKGAAIGRSDFGVIVMHCCFCGTVYLPATQSGDPEKVLVIPEIVKPAKDALSKIESIVAEEIW